MATGGQQPEVWLQGNLRPVLAIAAVAAVIAVACLGGLVALSAPPWAMALALGLVATVGVGSGSLAWGAAQPRLAVEGDAILVRLAPLVVERVPLGVVECVFRGTEPITADGEPPTFRVGTLVLRLAERATEWRQRPTFRPWGTWDDGHIVIDGRWCQPLSPDLAQRIATRLADAKRSAAVGSPP